MDRTLGVRKAVLVVMMVMVSTCYTQTCNCPGAHLPLEQRGCSPISGCRGGQVMDSCYCCLTCAKVLGETCGGKKQEEGRCDFGLYCHPRHSQEGESTHGICTAVPTTPAQQYGGGGYRNPYTLYPQLQTSSYYNIQPPAWSGYPVGSGTTTQRYPGQPAGVNDGTTTQRYPGQPAGVNDGTTTQRYPGQPAGVNDGTITQHNTPYPRQNYQPGGTQHYSSYPGQSGGQYPQPGAQPSGTQHYSSYPGQSGGQYPQPGAQSQRYPAYPGQSGGQYYQPGAQPQLYPAYPGQSGGQYPQPSYPGQSYQPGVGGSTQNWQGYYQQPQQTTSRYPQ